MQILSSIFLKTRLTELSSKLSHSRVQTSCRLLFVLRCLLRMGLGFVLLKCLVYLFFSNWIVFLSYFVFCYTFIFVRRSWFDQEVSGSILSLFPQVKPLNRYWHATWLLIVLTEADCVVSNVVSLWLYKIDWPNCNKLVCGDFVGGSHESRLIIFRKTSWKSISLGRAPRNQPVLLLNVYVVILVKLIGCSVFLVSCCPKN